MSIEVTKIPKEPQWEDIVIDSNKDFNWFSISNIVLKNLGLSYADLWSNLNTHGWHIINLTPPLRKGDALSMGNPIPAVVGGVLFSANDTLQSTNAHEMTKVKETRIWRPGAYRISFDLRSGHSGQSVWAELYRNGIRLGTERWSSSTTWQTFTEDVSGWNAGDFVQVYARSAGGHHAQVRNLRLFTQISFLAENLM